MSAKVYGTCTLTPLSQLMTSRSRTRSIALARLTHLTRHRFVVGIWSDPRNAYMVYTRIYHKCGAAGVRDPRVGPGQPGVQGASERFKPRHRTGYSAYRGEELCSAQFIQRTGNTASTCREHSEHVFSIETQEKTYLARRGKLLFVHDSSVYRIIHSAYREASQVLVHDIIIPLPPPKPFSPHLQNRTSSSSSSSSSTRLFNPASM